MSSDLQDPRALSALTQAAAYELLGEPLPGPLWKALCVHATDEELRRHLLNALASGVNLAEMILSPQGAARDPMASLLLSDAELRRQLLAEQASRVARAEQLLRPGGDPGAAASAAMNRLVRTVQALHLSEPRLFDMQDEDLFLLYHTARPGTDADTAMALLTEFTAVLAGTPRQRRVQVINHLLRHTDPKSADEFRQLCSAVVKILLGRRGGQVGIDDRRVLSQVLLHRATPALQGASEIWIRAATRLRLNPTTWTEQALLMWHSEHRRTTPGSGW